MYPRWRSIAWPFVVALSVVSCRRTTGPATTGDAADAATRDAGRLAERVVDAGATPVVDLLHHGPAVVAVSSTVDNPRDLPEHLVDGKLETAWNSRSGDEAARVTFTVPRRARVTAIGLTAGFDRVTPKGDDLFRMNPRFRTVVVSPHATVGAGDAGLPAPVTLALDPEKRGVQELPVALPGGTYTLEFLDRVPGSREDWRELVVSELRVLGVPDGDARPSMPEVRIGASVYEGDDPLGEAESLRLPYGEVAPDDKALCAAFERVLGPVNAASERRKPWCALGARLERASGGAVLDAKLVELNVDGAEVHGLALRTKAGWVFPEGAVLERGSCFRCWEDMNRKETKLAKVEQDASAVLFHFVQTTTATDGPGPPSKIVTTSVLRCELGAGPIRCARAVRRRTCGPPMRPCE